jgi:hypothetical protein
MQIGLMGIKSKDAQVFPIKDPALPAALQASRHQPGAGIA